MSNGLTNEFGSPLEPEQTPKEKRAKRIDELLTLIGGCEVALRLNPDDFKLQQELKKIKTQKLTELKDVIYGFSI
jgi:hypothetical protein